MHRPLQQLSVLLLCMGLTLPVNGQEASSEQTSPAETVEITPIASDLPETVKRSVLQDIQTRWDIEATQIEIISAEPQLWSDGCLGLAPPGEFCQEVFVVGWQVTVGRDRQQWVYRSNHSGSLVLWDQAGSPLDRLFTRQAKAAEQQPQRLPRRAVFREISNGGTAGLYRETLLLKDGRVLQRNTPEADFSAAPRVSQVSPEAVKTFRALLKQLRQFNGLCYPAPEGTADEITIFLSSKDSTTCYADREIAQLPSDLKGVMQAWNELIKPQPL
jgi:hypothetical protein